MDWPQPLRTLVGVMLASRQPMFTAWGPEWRLLYNDAYAPLLGRKHPGALGQPLFEVWPEVKDELAVLVDRVSAGEPVHMDDIALVLERHGAPEEAHFAFSYTPVHDAQGEVAGFFCPCTETTAQIAAERRRVAEGDRLRAMFAQAPGSVAIVRGPEHVFELANPAYLSLTGRHDVIGRTVREVFPDLEGQDFFTLLDTVWHSGEAFVGNASSIRLQRTPGSLAEERLLDFVYQPLLDGEGSVTGIFIQATDVTDRVQAEAALRVANERLEQQVAERTAALQDSEARLRGVFETSYQLKALLALDGTVLDANATALAVVQARIEDVVGKPFWETPWFSATPGMSQHIRAAVSAAANGENLRQEISVHVAAGLRTYDLSLRPVLDRQGAVVAIVPEAVDITDRRHTEEALRQSQKMEAVGQLTGGLAHDFNNLLTGIVGSLELMQTRIEQGRTSGLDRYAIAARGAADRAAALTHRLLAFSRRQTLDPKLVAVDSLARGIETLVRRTVKPAIEVVLVGGPDLWTTLCDPDQLENALLNLCINARDAMPEGGRLTIETANASVDGHAARMHHLPQGQYVTLSVTDTGSGMTADVVERAFDPFFTTKPLGQGTGLGLSMIYGFIKQSGGQVRIRSAVGHGTTVTLYLPRHEGVIGQVAMPAMASKGDAGETVLVVDDEPTVRMLVTEVLSELGYAALEAEDGPAGLGLLQSAARIDLLVTDVGLPGGMNGRQLADAARRFRPELKILFITGYAENAVIGNGHLDPGMHVLTKPFAMDALARRISELVTGRA